MLLLIKENIFLEIFSGIFLLKRTNSYIKSNPYENKTLNFGLSEDLKSKKINYNISNFYMTDPISRSSETMAKCSIEILNKAKAS